MIGVKIDGELKLDTIGHMKSKRGLGPFGKVQKYIDNEVIRRCDRRVPVQSHTLQKSAKLHSKIGSGEVLYVTPYAARQYYNNDGSAQMESLRKGLWFELMKNAEKKEILEGAQRIAGERI